MRIRTFDQAGELIAERSAVIESGNDDSDEDEEAAEPNGEGDDTAQVASAND